MRKYIITLVGLAFTMQITAQKVFVVHKKDGSTIEIPLTNTISFSGKAKVNDNEYTRISSTNVVSDVEPNQKPYAEITIDESGSFTYGNFTPSEKKGLLYSVTEDVTLESDTDVQIEEGNTVTLDNLDFDTSYYLRSYVTYQGNVFYSNDTLIYIGRPYMRWYGVDVDTDKYKESGYVLPTESAIESLFTTYSDNFASTNPGFRAAMFYSIWMDYLTTDKAKEVAGKCTNKHVCEDGTIYLLDEISEDFMTMFDQVDVTLKGNEGLLDTLCQSYTSIDTVICDASLNVPGNVYYEFNPSGPNARPKVSYLINTPMLAGRTYEVQVVMAPNAEATVEEPGKPNFINVDLLSGSLKNGDNNYKKMNLVKNYTTSTTECDVITATVTPTEFGENAIQIVSRGVAVLKKYDLAPRIVKVSIKVVK